MTVVLCLTLIVSVAVYGPAFGVAIVLGISAVYLIFRDISLRDNSRLAQEFQRSLEGNRLVLGNVKDHAIFMLDMAGRVVSWNDGARQIKGYCEEDILGKSFEIFYPEEAIAEREPAHNLEMARKYGHYEREGWRVKKDGSLFWADITFTALTDEHGQLYGYSKITRDVTERRKAKEELELLSLQINRSNDAIYTVDTDLKISTWNRGAEILYGYSREEAIGTNPNELLKTKVSQEELNSALKTVQRDDYWAGELTRIKKNGQKIHVRATTSAIRNDRQVIVGYLAVSLNITIEKKLREQVDHLAIMVDHSTEAIITRGRDQRVLSWNKGAEDLFGITKGEALGKTIGELAFLPLDQEKIFEVERLIAESGAWKAEQTFQHRSGTAFWGLVTGNAVRNAAGEVTAFIFIISDITQRKTLEDTLKKFNEELEGKVLARTEELRKSEKRFRSLIEHNYDAISLLNASFAGVYRSASAFRITGWTEEEMSAPGSILSRAHPEDRENLRKCFNEALANPGLPIKAIFRSQHKNGHYIWLEGTATNMLHEQYVESIVINFREVTVRVEAEQKAAKTLEDLASSELRFRSLIENSVEGISMLAENSDVIYRSPSAYHIIGASPRTNSIDHTHPDDKQLLKAKFEESLSKPGIPVAYRIRYAHASGRIFWAEGTFMNLLDLKAVGAVVANYRDVSSRIEAEDKLKASEEHYRMLVEQAVDGIFLSDAHGQYLDANSAGCRMLGYSHEELTQLNIVDVLDPTELDRFSGQIELLSSGAIVTSEWKFRRKDGTIFFGEVIGRVLPDGRLQGILRDITERRKAADRLEQTYRENRLLTQRMAAILDTLPANIALLDGEGFVIDVNLAWKRFADDNGYNGKNYGIGLNYLSAAGGVNGQAGRDGLLVASGIKEVLNGARGQFMHEYPCHSPQVERWFRMVVTPLQDREQAGAVVMHIDISELRRLEAIRRKSESEEQKKVAEAMFETQETERSAIGAELHDNVNQLLVAATLYLGLARNHPENPSEYIDTSMQSIRNAVEENRKIAHRLVAPDFGSTTLAQLLDQLVDRMLGTAGIEVCTDFTTVCEDLLNDDLKLAIYRVAQEQCTNIIKYAEAKSATFCLRIADGCLNFVITDDGKGADPGKLPTGVGLRNIKGRLSIFNGKVRIDTARNGGFTLNISIPMLANGNFDQLPFTKTNKSKN